jgi:hypothetical protein
LSISSGGASKCAAAARCRQGSTVIPGMRSRMRRSSGPPDEADSSALYRLAASPGSRTDITSGREAGEPATPEELNSIGAGSRSWNGPQPADPSITRQHADNDSFGDEMRPMNPLDHGANSLVGAAKDRLGM